MRLRWRRERREKRGRRIVNDASAWEHHYSVDESELESPVSSSKAWYVIGYWYLLLFTSLETYKLYVTQVTRLEISTRLLQGLSSTFPRRRKGSRPDPIPEPK